MRRIAVLDAPSNLGLRPPTPTSVPGCAKAPGALRDHGLLPKLAARDAGCLTPPRYDPGDWRPGDGVAHAAEIAAYSRALADRIGAIIDGGEFPVVLGGDCSILIGSGLAMHRLGEAVGGRIGLVFVDGHSDFRHPGNASYVGAAAGEDLALVTGRGQANLAAIESRRPYFRDIDVVVLGIRAQDEYRLDLQAAGIVTRPVPMLRAEGAARSAQWARDQLVDCAGYWVHVDVDVLDPAVMPAVDAPDPGGIAFPELELLLTGLVESPHCLGVEITVFDPDYDPDGRYAAEITSAVVSGLAPVRTVTPRPDLIAARRDLANQPAAARGGLANQPASRRGLVNRPAAAAPAAAPIVPPPAPDSEVPPIEPDSAVLPIEPESAVPPATPVPAVPPIEADATAPTIPLAGADSAAPAGLVAEFPRAEMPDEAGGADADPPLDEPVGEVEPAGPVTDIDPASEPEIAEISDALAVVPDDATTFSEDDPAVAVVAEPDPGLAVNGSPDPAVEGDPAFAINGHADPAVAINGHADPAFAIEDDADPASAIESAADPASAIEGDIDPALAVEDDADPASVIEGDVDPAPAVEDEADPAPAIEGDVDPVHAVEGDTDPDLTIVPDVDPVDSEHSVNGSADDPPEDEESTSTEPAEDDQPVTVVSEVRLLTRPLGSAPLLDSEPLPATRPGMLRPRPPADPPAEGAFTLHTPQFGKFPPGVA